MSETSNPWNLSTLQCQALEATIEHGREKVAAESVGVSRSAFISRMREAKRVMGAPTRIHAIVQFDRWARGQQ